MNDGSDDGSIFILHFPFFKFLLRHLVWDFVRPKMTKTKMLMLSTLGLYGSAKALTMASSPLVQTLFQIGAYTFYFIGVFEVFGVMMRTLTLHRLYFCCAHDSEQ